jgi:hypothetical protein
MTSALKILLIVIAVVIALSIISAIISALKWLLILAGIIFVVGLVGSWSRRGTS